MVTNGKYQVFTERNYRKIPQIEKYLSEDEKFAIDVVGKVLPFKVDSYVINELIDWNNIPDDPIFRLTFPHQDMLSKEDFNDVANAMRNHESTAEIAGITNNIRFNLNPNPAGQMEHNVPELNGTKLTGIQHKYDQTALFFPHHGQTCHAYCTFCFRWPQFIGIDELKFAMRETELLVEYVKTKPQITDILFTGGDPMVMSAHRFEDYINPILDAKIPHLKNIRIGSKSLAYWPYRYLTDKDSDDLLRVFEKIVKAGYHLSFMAHFNHPNELKTEAVQKAIQRIRNTGANIRTQSPLLNHINNDPNIWAEMWEKQVSLGAIPYYMFMARNTGAQEYFAVSLVDAWNVFRQAYQQVSGVARTVRGPSMSAEPGKVQMLGVAEMNKEKVMMLRFLQGREADWVHRPFFAKYDENAIWLDDLKPAFGESHFFFQEQVYQENDYVNN